MFELELSRFGVKLVYSAVVEKDYCVSPGHRIFFIICNNIEYEHPRYSIDTRDNTLNFPFDLKYFSEFDIWLTKIFKEYKESNFKFGNDMYDPTEQITIEGFFGHLRKCNRDEIIDSIY